MKRQRKKYERPARPFDKQRIEAERNLMKTYGLRKKVEIWKTEGLIRKYRRLARELAAKSDEQKEKTLIEKLVKLGVLNENAKLDDVLGLTIETFLNRRLQTVVQQKGFATTAKQARQMIVHGHVKIAGRKITYPSYLVSRLEESSINAIQPTTKVVKNG